MTLAIERLAAVRGETTAVVDDSAGTTVSYRGLADRTGATAAGLADLGVDDGDVVAVVSRNRVEVLALLFAARRLGAALAPVSYRLATDAAEALCRRLDAAVVLHEPAARDVVRGLDRAVTFQKLRARDGPVPPARAGDDDDATCLFLHAGAEAGPATDCSVDDDAPPGERTAGSPPAYRFAGRAVERNCLTVASALGLGRQDAVPLARPLADPAGLLGVALPVLWAGGTLLVHRAFDPPDALSAVETHDATFLAGGAVEFRELTGNPGFDDADLSTVEWVLAGDRLGDGTRRALADRGLDVRRAYGRLPAGPNVCLVPPAADPSDPSCVGRPFPDCEVRLVGDGGADAGPVAAGEVGDLQVRGPTTAAGTLDHPDAFEGEWLATGDRARRDDDGRYVLVE